MAKPAHHFHFWYFVVALLGVLAIQRLWTEARSVESVPYSEFQRLLKDGQVDEIAIADHTIQGKYKQPQPDRHTRFVTVRVEPGLAAELEKSGVKFAGVTPVKVPVARGARRVPRKSGSQRRPSLSSGRAAANRLRSS